MGQILHDPGFRVDGTCIKRWNQCCTGFSEETWKNAVWPPLIQVQTIVAKTLNNVCLALVP